MQVTRKSFFRILFTFILVVTSLLIIRFLKALPFFKSYSKIRLIKNVPVGISFFDDIISVRYHKSLKIFSSRCTHLGCRINQFDGNNFKCLCHGSEFNIDGVPVSGPATQPLKVLNSEYSDNNDEIKVYLE